MLVAGGGDGSQQFARALAWGIVAAVDALLTFLGLDSLLRRIARPLGRPMGRTVARLSQRARNRRSTRQARRRRRDEDDRRTGARRGDDQHRARAQASRARTDRRAEARRARTATERRTARAPSRGQQSRSERRRERERRRRERLERRWRMGMAAVQRLINRDRDEAGISPRRFRAELLWIRVRHRFSRLQLDHAGDGYVVVARMNPGDRRRVGGYLIDRNRISYPTGENASTGEKDWGISRRGNQRLFFIKPRGSGVRAYVFFARGTNRGNWQAILGSGAGGEAERLARQHLETTKEQYVALIPADRHPAAPGFDVGGVGREPGEPEERLFLGEAKESSAGRRFTARGVTAFHGSPFRSNIRGLAEGEGPEVTRVRTALEAGRITYQVYLRGNAQYSERQRRRLETLVKISLRAYLRTLRLSREQIGAAIRNVRVPPPVRLP